MLIHTDHKCLLCGIKHEFEVDKSAEVVVDGLKEWQNGMFIQDALPFLDANQREILMTGTCQEAWDEMFPEEDEGDLK